MNQIEELQTALGGELGIAPNPDKAAFYKSLCDAINHLINNDFAKLTNILYKVDIDENKLKELMKSSKGKDAAPLIADMMIERQLQKIKMRKVFRGKNNIKDDDSW